MGNQLSTACQGFVSDPNFLIGLEKIGGMGSYQLWKRLSTGDEYQQYNIYSGQNTRWDRDRQLYQFRKQQKMNLVVVHHIDVMENPYTCQGYQQLRVFTERMPIMLCQLQQIPFGLSIFIIRQALAGFKAIFSNLGYLPVSDELIGVNSTGKVKVWLNANLGSNHPKSTPKDKVIRFSQETQVVRELFQTVEKHTQQSAELYALKKMRDDMGLLLDFTTAQILIANFCIEHRLLLPYKLELEQLKNFMMPGLNREPRHLGAMSSRVRTYSETPSQKSGLSKYFQKEPSTVSNNGGIQKTPEIKCTPISFKKPSSSVPKLGLKAFASPTNHQNRLHFTLKKKTSSKKKRFVNTLQRPKKEHSETSNGNEFNTPNPTTPTNAHYLLKKYGNNFSCQRPDKVNVSQSGGFFQLHQTKPKNYLTLSCEPQQKLKDSSYHSITRSGLPNLQIYREPTRLAGPRLQDKSNTTITNSIMLEEPQINIINVDLCDMGSSKEGGSDCQATNIYNSNNSLQKQFICRTQNHFSSPKKTNKFEDKVLSSGFFDNPIYVQPPRIVSLDSIKSVKESILEISPEKPRQKHYYSSERMVSKYSILNQKEICVSQFIKDDIVLGSRNIEPDVPALQKFFAQNKLDYEKYKQIITNRGSGELKQSITYEELGRLGENSRIISKEQAAPMLLDRYAKREVTRSMTIDEKAIHHLQAPSQHDQSNRLLSSIIVPTNYAMDMIQENETEGY